MFQEFINRTGFQIPGLGGIERRCANFVVKYAHKFPELFFFFVLAGEDPIDYVQRQTLRKNRQDTHPLIRRIMQIHVTEEARHMSFPSSSLLWICPKKAASAFFPDRTSIPKRCFPLHRLKIPIKR